MKKLIGIMVLVFVFTLSSCKTESVIKIGFVNSLDYTFGSLGVDSMYGVLLAVDEINEAGGIDGKQIELIIRDDHRDADIAVEMDNELKELGAVAIIGHGYSLTAEAISANAIENDIFLISPTIATHQTISNKDDNFFRITPSTYEQGKSLANAMHMNSPGDTVIIYEGVNTAFSYDLVLAFIEQYESLGYDIDIENNIRSFDINNPDDHITMKNFIENKGIENVLAIGSSFDIGNIIQSLDNPDNHTFYLPAWTSTSDIFEISGGKIEENVAINFYDFQSSNIKFVQFENNYMKEFGRRYSYSSLLGYETMYVLKQVLEQADDYSVETLKETIIEIGTFEVLMDEFTINEYGDCLRNVYYYEIYNNEFITIGYDQYD